MTGNVVESAPAAKHIEGDLTSDRSPFIAEAQRTGTVYVCQPYELYSESNHASWKMLYGNMREYWRRYAAPAYLEGIERLNLDPDRVPRLEDVNRFLQPLTGFRAVGVGGYLPAFYFFDNLHNREFPTTITIRPEGAAFAEWPDIFHDITGHVPLHTDPDFAATLARMGDCAHTAVAMAREARGDTDRMQRLTGNIRALSRFFWFTVETGLMRQGGELKVYGSALLSSSGEIMHAMSDNVAKRPVDIETIINQAFIPNQYQPVLYITESFEQLYELVDRIEEWMHEGKLDSVAGGGPLVSESDLNSFLQHV